MELVKTELNGKDMEKIIQLLKMKMRKVDQKKEELNLK